MPARSGVYSCEFYLFVSIPRAIVGRILPCISIRGSSKHRNRFHCRREFPWTLVHWPPTRCVLSRSRLLTGDRSFTQAAVTLLGFSSKKVIWSSKTTATCVYTLATTWVFQRLLAACLTKDILCSTTSRCRIGRSGGLIVCTISSNYKCGCSCNCQ